MYTSFLREDIKTSSHHKNEGHISQYESQIQGEGGTNLSDRGGKLSQHLCTCPDLLGLTHPPLASCSRYSCNGSDLLRAPLTTEAHKSWCSTPSCTLPSLPWSILTNTKVQYTQTHSVPAGPAAEFAVQTENVKSLIQKA